MKKLIYILLLGMLLSGCGQLTDAGYVSIKPHEDQGNQIHSASISASDYGMLCTVLEDLVAVGTEGAVINVGGYDQNMVAEDMENAVSYIRTDYPIGAYAMLSTA